MTMKAHPKNKHFRVHVEGNMLKIGQQAFDTIEDLVDHYKKHPIFKSENEKLFLQRHFVHPLDATR